MPVERQVVFDGWSGEPIGFYLEGAEVIDSHYCVSSGTRQPITRWLTHEEAIELYGPVTEEPRGPQGGWRSITFGTTKFISRHLAKRATAS